MNQNITKANGSNEEFSKAKINSSLIKAGASPELAASTSDEIEKESPNFMNTGEIYNYTLNHLRNAEPKIALKYTLKRAIMDLGPAGFIFEKYMSKILKNYGYTIELDKIISGFCVDHEVDIIAEKMNERFMVECKYHNMSGIHSDVKTALYINSRFLDIEKACINKLNNQRIFSKAWLVTNTKCTNDAIKYANCVNIKITSWNYPHYETLQYFIENKKLYPITILSTISELQIKKLLETGILMINELSGYQADSLSHLLSIDQPSAFKVLDEVSMLLK
ncbi:MAG: restriction endonuclease [Cyanobacteria bacterium]|nr:restriction endonuclease [Cyanobacteriota bacterium]